MDISKIFGPPGCGKTTRLLDLLDQEMAGDVKPERVAFVSFTRKAVREAIDRVKTRFGIEQGELPYFRTLHSLTYRGLSLARNEVMRRSDYQEFGDLHRYEWARYWNNEDGPPELERGLLADHFLFVYDYHRTTGIPLEEAYRSAGIEEMQLDELHRFVKRYQEFKVDTGRSDFTDMLLEFKYDGEPLDIDVAFIDEAQDLTPLQWDVAELAFRNARRLYLAGDDDQCIYSWCGAQVERFIDYPGWQEVLHQSHRVPKDVQHLASHVASLISKRIAKDWKARSDDGEVSYVEAPDYLDFEKPGSYLVLTRNAYHLKALERLLREEGHLYETRYGLSIDDGDVKAIQAYRRLRVGESITRSEVSHLYAAIPSGPKGIKRGFKQVDKMPDKFYSEEHLRSDWGFQVAEGQSWENALTRIPRQELFYYRALLRRGEILDKPRIRVSTIHGVKGGEADHVVLGTDITPRTAEALDNFPDNEHRVWYVGVTRARQTLQVLEPQTGRFYGHLTD